MAYRLRAALTSFIACCQASVVFAQAAPPQVELLDLSSGAIALSATSEYDQIKWSALTLLDATIKTGWATKEGEIYGNVIVLELPYEAALDRFVVDTRGVDGAGRAARNFILLGSNESATVGFEVLLSAEAANEQRTEFSITNRKPVRWLQLKVADNWGDASYTEIMELEAYGERIANEAPLQSVEGVYDTNYKLMRIHQNGSNVEGCYDWDNGVLSGDTDGRVIRFEWREDAPLVGNAIMVLNAKADFLNGFWYVGGELRGVWFGPRVTDGREPACKVGLTNVVADALDQGGPATLYGIRFDLDSDRLRHDSAQTLNALLQAMNAHPAWRIAIFGHTDSQGADSYNLDLSSRRSAAVKAWLVANGIKASRMETFGKGETQPAADNATPQGRTLNRRVVISVIS